MKKVILTKGLPGSGKTTWAKQMVADNFNAYKIVCKDDLRAMLDNGKWSQDAERLILKIRDAAILSSLEAGKNVIVADTNLAEKHEAYIRQLVKGLAEVEIKDFTTVPLEECITNDLKRLNSVGEKVIRDMYKQFFKPPVKSVVIDPSLLDVYLFDLDGTLAHMNGRGPFDWDRVGEDTLDENVCRIAKELQANTQIIFLSGREDVCRSETRAWLDRAGFSGELLLMRKAGDKRKDFIVKKEIYDQEVNGKYNVRAVFDDRNQVVDMWRECGLTVCQVAEGDF